MNSTMRAAIYTEYGSPEVLQIEELEKPMPQDNEILVKIHATTVSATDSIFRSGIKFSARLFWGLMKPKSGILGSVLAGEVESVGQDVTLFKPGDEIFGTADISFGAHAEYKTLAEDGILAIKPSDMTYEEAVVIAEGLTSLYFIRELANTSSGQKVLINGASGAIGTFAVQLAKHFGAEVTGVSSTANLELVKSLGADHVIDYTREDFTENHDSYDIIFDTVGKSSFSRSKGALTQDGLFLTIDMTFDIFWHMLWTKFSRKKAILGLAGLNQEKEQLMFLKELVESGKLKPVTDRSYPLSDIAEAHRYVDTGRKKGNVVITMAHQN